MTPRPIIVGQDAQRDGEGIFLLSAVSWLVEHHRTRPEILLWHGGPLEEELGALGPVRVLTGIDTWWVAGALERIGLRTPARRLQSLRLRWWMFRRRRAPVIYCNGLRCARLLAWAPEGRPRAVTQVHGGGNTLQELSAEDRATVLQRTDRFVAGSDAAAALGGAGVAAEQVCVQGFFTDLNGSDTDPRDIRRQLDLPEGVPVVASTGAADWWSAPDLFPVVAWRVAQALPQLPVHFLWLSDADDDQLWPFWHDVRNVGLVERFRVARPSPDGREAAVADALVLTAPGAAGHAPWLPGAAGVPVVCTAGADAGVDSSAHHVTVVPYLDLDAVVQAVEAALGEGRAAAARAEQTAGWERLAREVEAGGPLLAHELGLDG